MTITSQRLAELIEDRQRHVAFLESCGGDPDLEGMLGRARDTVAVLKRLQSEGAIEPERKTDAELQKLADKICKYMQKTAKGLCTDDWVELCELVEHQARVYIEAVALYEDDE